LLYCSHAYFQNGGQKLVGPTLFESRELRVRCTEPPRTWPINLHLYHRREQVTLAVCQQGVRVERKKRVLMIAELAPWSSQVASSSRCNIVAMYM